MLELEEALTRILAELPEPIPERVPLSEAHGRVLSEPIHSPMDLPPFDNSAMDGYAVRAADVSRAAVEAPTCLRLCGKTAAGETLAGEVTEGACVRVFTGSPLPRGADAVVMQEDTRTEAPEAVEVLILDAIKLWENVRLRGEDVKRGARVADAGEVVTVGRVSLLAALGLTHVAVGRLPEVGLLATGSELREAGQPLAPGQIYESNRAGLAALLRRAGIAPHLYPLVTDTLATTHRALEEAFSECEIVITSGGVSVGEMDFVKNAFEQLGGQLQFWKLAIRPGRPFVFGRLGARFLFGLPGNPVSALVTFLLLVRPALLHWQGARQNELPSHPGVLSEALMNSGERRHFLRVHVDTAGMVRSAGTQASHILSSLAVANGLVDVPPKTILPPGAAVRVLLWE